MKEVSMFSKAFVVSGKKVNSSIRPEVVLTTTKDKFVINDKALRLMGLTQGDRVAMFDMLGVPGADVSTQEDRFFITKSFKHGGVDAGAKIGNNATFSYSGIYSGILMNSIDVKECNAADLVRAGKGIIREESGNFIAGNKIKMEVVEYGMFSPMEDLPEQMIYALKNFEFEENTGLFDTDDEDLDVELEGGDDDDDDDFDLD